ncbi:hypothetical protein FWH30_01680 [Microgenomates group bacterium]|nr:hypothetical protein [Microgenomates group bacterium]
MAIKKISSVLTNLTTNPTSPHELFADTPPVKINKHIQNPIQLRALQLADKFSDRKNKVMYLNVCKTLSDVLIDQAEQFATDAPTDTKGALFMWKIKQLRSEYQKAGKNFRREPHSPPKTRSRPPKQKGLFAK